MMPDTIWIRDTTWNAIREQFTEDEKAVLRANVCGETICPRGLSVDLTGLGPLAEKLSSAVKAVQKGER
jgi:hypothetical protein